MALWGLFKLVPTLKAWAGSTAVGKFSFAHQLHLSCFFIVTYGMLIFALGVCNTVRLYQKKQAFLAFPHLRRSKYAQGVEGYIATFTYLCTGPAALVYTAMKLGFM